MEIAVQLYTLRDACGRDFAGTLERVAKIGYRAVELAGLHGMTAAAAKKKLDECGLRPVSAHVGYDRLTGALDEVSAEAKQIGYRYVVCPGIFDEQRRTAEGYRGVAKALQAAGEQLKSEGLELAYHNHAFEFETVGAKTGLQWLRDETRPETMKFEIDTYWVHEGGQDPASLIRELGPRCALVHLKDRARDGSFAEVGSGTLDFDAIFKAARAARASALIVEQDTCPGDPFDCIAKSLLFLQGKGLA